MSPLRGPEVAQGGASGGSQTGIEQRPYEPARGSSEPGPAGQPLGVAYRVWNAAAFPGASDKEKVEAALAEAVANGRGAIWLGGKSNWSLEGVKVNAGIRVSGAAFGIATKLETSSTTAFILELGVAGDASEIEVEHMFFRAAAKQSSGGAIGWAAPFAFVNLHDLKLGSNLFIGINCAGFAGGNLTVWNVFWNDGGAKVKNSTKGIVLGDGEAAHHLVDVNLWNLEGEANAAGDMAVWVDVNFTDTLTFWDALFFGGENGIRLGAASAELSTGCKFTHVTADTCSKVGWKIQNARDTELTACNAQTCGTKLVGTGMQVASGCNGCKIKGGTIQNCQNHGFVATAGAEHFYLDGVDITDNNKAKEGGSGVAIAAGVSKWHMRNCTSGNFYGLAGEQQFGILVEAGASTDFHVTDNTWAGNSIAGVENLGTGTSQTWKRNITTGVARTYGAKTERATGTPLVASKTNEVFMSLAIQCKAALATKVELLVDGVWAGEASIGVDVSGITILDLQAMVPATKTWELKVIEGTVEKLFSSYFLL